MATAVACIVCDKRHLLLFCSVLFCLETIILQRLRAYTIVTQHIYVQNSFAVVSIGPNHNIIESSILQQGVRIISLIASPKQSLALVRENFIVDKAPTSISIGSVSCHSPNVYGISIS